MKLRQKGNKMSRENRNRLRAERDRILNLLKQVGFKDTQTRDGLFIEKMGVDIKKDAISKALKDSGYTIQESEDGIFAAKDDSTEFANKWTQYLVGK